MNLDKILFVVFFLVFFYWLFQNKNKFKIDFEVKIVFLLRLRI